MHYFILFWSLNLKNNFSIVYGASKNESVTSSSRFNVQKGYKIQFLIKMAYTVYGFFWVRRALGGTLCTDWSYVMGGSDAIAGPGLVTIAVNQRSWSRSCQDCKVAAVNEPTDPTKAVLQRRAGRLTATWLDLERLTETRAGWTEVRKVGVSCSRLCSGVGLLGSFPLMASFISGVSRLDSVPGDEYN